VYMCIGTLKLHAYIFIMDTLLFLVKSSEFPILHPYQDIGDVITLST